MTHQSIKTLFIPEVMRTERGVEPNAPRSVWFHLRYGTVSSFPTGSAPFLCSMLPLGSTLPNYNSYGATAADTNDFNGCSAACYVGFMLGYTYGVSDGYSFSSVSGNPQFVTTLASAGLTWQAYCESGCPRGDDHFPFSGANTFASSSVSTSSFVTAANSA